MGRLKKCPICGQDILDTEESIPYKGNRYIHKRCFQSSMKIVKEERAKKQYKKAENVKTKLKQKSHKPLSDIKEGLTEEEFQRKQKVYNYVRQHIIGEIPMDIYAKTDGIMKKYHLSYEDVLMTLKYLFEVLQRKDIEGGGVGLVPFYFTQARRYYDNIKIINENNANQDVKQMYKKKEIIIDPRKKRVPNNLIDIEDIGEDEE